VIGKRPGGHRADEHADKRCRRDRRDRCDRELPLLAERGRRVREAVQIAEFEEEHIREKRSRSSMKGGDRQSIQS
jgi:hypothetical protein